ncbi:MAG: hypothetical protein MUC53_12015, partial [Candidatus Contendobacter sp.]|nr:hypothetical protein [Candidatus Contendobacter sp.]
MKSETMKRDDYDTPWKQMLARYFPAFLEFFFPAAYELHKVVRDAALGQRRADALMRVTGRDGVDDWVLALPEGLENQLWAEVQQFEEEKHMRYVSSL